MVDNKQETGVRIAAKIRPLIAGLERIWIENIKSGTVGNHTDNELKGRIWGEGSPKSLSVKGACARVIKIQSAVSLRTPMTHCPTINRSAYSAKYARQTIRFLKRI